MVSIQKGEGFGVYRVRGLMQNNSGFIQVQDSGFTRFVLLTGALAATTFASMFVRGTFPPQTRPRMQHSVRGFDNCWVRCCEEAFAAHALLWHGSSPSGPTIDSRAPPSFSQRGRKTLQYCPGAKALP